jgi:hypothetical protein
MSQWSTGRIVDAADRVAGDPRARALRSALVRAAILDKLSSTDPLSPLGTGNGHYPSATELFNSFVHADPAPYRACAGTTSCGL